MWTQVVIHASAILTQANYQIMPLQRTFMNHSRSHRLGLYKYRIHHLIAHGLFYCINVSTQLLMIFYIVRKIIIHSYWDWRHDKILYVIFFLFQFFFIDRYFYTFYERIDRTIIKYHFFWNPAWKVTNRLHAGQPAAHNCKGACWPDVCRGSAHSRNPWQSFFFFFISFPFRSCAKSAKRASVAEIYVR